MSGVRPLDAPATVTMTEAEWIYLSTVILEALVERQKPYPFFADNHWRNIYRRHHADRLRVMLDIIEQRSEP